MNTPEFTADASLYKTSGRYFKAASTLCASQAVTPQLKCPPPGLCAKASQLCHDPTKGGGWCAILDRCVDCHGA